MELSAENREILGKKVKQLRRQGITPAHLFGHNVEPLPLQCDTIELKKTLAFTGTTGLISLKVGKSRKKRNVMVREIQREPRTDELLHVDFHEVSMEEKIRVDVPIIAVGEAPALKLKENFLAHDLNSLTIECWLKTESSDRHTYSRIVSKGISAGKSNNSYLLIRVEGLFC